MLLLTTGSASAPAARRVLSPDDDEPHRLWYCSSVKTGAQNATPLCATILMVVTPPLATCCTTLAPAPTGMRVVSADLLSVNIASRDFRLQAQSPAIEAGVNTGITLDCDGVLDTRVSV